MFQEDFRPLVRVSVRKPITIRNRTNYFNTETSKTHVKFLSSSCYQNQKAKKEGYELRLYWQFRFCQENNGQVFFYTLTYNDKACPHYAGRPCFNYKHLVELLTGGFQKRLLREYGTKFKYFVGAELGEGKGKRGLENNPHYHILFFLEDAKDETHPYKKIPKTAFQHLVRLYWQGFDEDTDGWRDFRTAKYGIAKSGDDFGLVHSFSAIVYVAKYVCKDVRVKRQEQYVKDWLASKFNHLLYIDFNKCLADFCVDCLCPITKIQYEEFNKDLILHDIKSFGLEKHWYHHLKIYSDNAARRFDERVKQAFNDYRNIYSNKCRCSHGLGLYGLNYIKDKLHPTLTIPDKKSGWKERSIGMYYYRKLYCDVVKDSKNPDPSLRNQNLYLLNELGIRYKETRRIEQQAALSEKTSANLACLDRHLFSVLRMQGWLKNFSYDYDWFNLNFKQLSQDEQRKIVDSYALYKVVYEYRFFPYKLWGRDCDTNIAGLDPICDYRRFLSPAFYEVSYDSRKCAAFIQEPSKAFLSYRSHPYFLQASCFFDLFDALSDYFFINADEEEEQRAEKIRETKRFHNKLTFKNYLITKKAV